MPPTAARKPARRTKPVKRPRLLRFVLFSLAAGVAFFYGSIITLLLLLRWVNPPTTSIQAERSAQSWFQAADYRKQFEFVPLIVSLTFPRHHRASRPGPSPSRQSPLYGESVPFP